ncbi:hypothetical protein GA0070624_2896 [Micromonospora rhizosphaerae]|uniref:Flavin reductase n=1 Tax=Micromonospora rhizosphaerae TaxID=568872 RepID=A0A1C6S4B9_9ACTN|nr:flavin reductase [Micromonospora rhizosphaerae]SCL24306.1 hypothetical protein GA0070624_2896 [Micromonospora rhizosphaerae]
MSRSARPHVPMRPLWRCRACGAEWPCQPARLALLVEYRDDRPALLVYLGTLMHEAGEQLAQLNGHARPADLPDRFLSWALPRGRDPEEDPRGSSGLR